MIQKKILLTCPPMIKQIDSYKDLLSKYNFEIHIPKFTQIMKEQELIKLLPEFDGWIIGDDPATKKVFESGLKGKFKAAVKWGVGVDNVDFEACKDLNIPITNTPGVFGEEVSDVALGYLLCLSRELNLIDKKNRIGEWYKPVGMSLSNKKVCLLGFGDIGRCTAKKLLAFGLDVSVYDPGFSYDSNNKIICNYNKDLIIGEDLNKIKLLDLDECLNQADFIICTCPLNDSTHHIVNKNNILKSKKGVIIINVARGSVVSESDVVELLEEGFIKSVGFDVFENEPVNLSNPLLKFEQNILGSHNASNSKEAVNKVSLIALEKIFNYLN